MYTKKMQLFILALVILGGCIVRLYKFSQPVADWHAWRQVDTSAVSRNFIRYGFDILHPKFDDFSKGVSLIDNPQGHRFVEFPLYNLAQAGLYKTFDYFTLEQWGRIVTIFSQLVSTLFIYLLVKKYSGTKAAIFAAGFFAFIPYNIYYGRTLLPDSSMVMTMLGGIYFFDLWIEKNTKHKKSNIKYWLFFILALLFTSSAFLLKPYAIFFTLPMVYLSFRTFGIGIIKQRKLWVFLVLAIAPLIFWRVWMIQYPAGIPRTDWLFNQYGIRFKGAFFQWLFAERIGHLILGFFGLPFVILGIMAKNKKEGLLWYSFLASSFLYMSVIAYGNVHHDYYQILIIPTLAIFFGKGISFILDHTANLFNRYASYIGIIVCILFMFAFSWFKIRDYYNLQHLEVLIAGEAVDKLTPKEAKIIAPYGGDTTLLYHTNRRGWPVWDRSIQEFLKAGAQYLVFVKPNAEEYNFKKYFPVVGELNSTYVIYDLAKPLSAAEEILKPKKDKK